MNKTKQRQNRIWWGHLVWLNLISFNPICQPVGPCRRL
ncbi:BgtTE-56042 [Blumeria graminis f. sp. tritici]|uniref:BgtTE-56042 n=1 Tax=Blumeria graminis f. sp. tritici TaxID=62690 RepID=A0A9X9QBG3_BLUGR|nr:BgtTE-56042 [Blumeria graminis f. sp. tritici]